MSQAVIGLNNFNGGEIDPRGEGRTDLPQYATSARKQLNMIPLVSGALTRRPGTQHATEALHPTDRSRLIDFRIGTNENYIIELNAYRMRVFKDDTSMKYLPRAIRSFERHFTAVATGLFVTEFGHGFHHGQKVEWASNPPPGFSGTPTSYYVCLPRAFVGSNFFANGTGMPTSELANLETAMGPYLIFGDVMASLARPWGDFYIAEKGPNIEFCASRYDGSGGPLLTVSLMNTNLAVVPTEEAMAKTFRLATDPDDLHGTVVTGTGTWTGATLNPTDATREIILTHPWDKDEIWDLTFAQDTDRLRFYHRDFPPFQLSRWDVGAFRMVPFEFQETPYGDVSPLGVGTENRGIVFTESSRAPIEVQTIDRAFFDAGMIGQSFTTRNDDFSTSQGSRFEWKIGRVERLSNAIQAKLLTYRVFGVTTGDDIDLGTGDGFADNDLVSLADAGGGLPGGLEIGKAYYVVNVAAATLELSLTLGGSNVIDTSVAAGGADNKLILLHFSAINNLDVVVAHGWDDNDERIGFQPNGLAPDGMLSGKLFRFRLLTANTFYLEEFGGVDDGKPIAVTSEGSGRFWLSKDNNGEDEVARVRWTVDEGKPTFTGTPNHFFQAGTLGPILGWPGVGTLHEQRHILGSSYAYPNRVWMSITAGPNSFSARELDEDVFAKAISGTSISTLRPRNVIATSALSIDPVTNQTSALVWALSHNTLIIASSSEIMEIAASSDRQAITPTNINMRVVSNVGANKVQPMRLGTDVVYVSNAGRQMLALLFDGLAPASAPVDLTVFAGHVTDSSIVQMAWQQEPYKVLWTCREDGRMYAMTYDRDQAVTAWHRHELGGSFGSDSFGHVQSVAVAPHRDASNARGDYDRLWMSVFRDINSIAVQHIEFMTRGFENWSADQEAHHVDDAPAPFSGPSTVTPLTGMTWLEAETLEIFANGATLPSEVVASGTMTIDTASTYVVAGLGFTSDYQSLPLDAVVDDTTTIQAIKKRIVDLFLRVDRTHAGTIGQDTGGLESLGNLADGTNVPFTGLLKARAFKHEWDEEATVFLRITGPAPFHLNAMMARLDWSER